MNGWAPSPIKIDTHQVVCNPPKIRLGKHFNKWWLPGSVSIFVILILTGLPVVALILTADTLTFSSILSNPFYQHVIWFSFYQAALSTCLSVCLAIPVARALSREPKFPGRSLLVSLFSLSLVIPTIVAVFGLVAVYGTTGWINTLLAIFDVEPFSIYGLSGILLAHVFFNMPLASRILMQALEGIPAEHWRLATQLGMRTGSQFRIIEWPYIRGLLPDLILLIFALCFTSFAIVMTLGGGPRATTIEVAIYQSLRFDFDIDTAVTLALIQLAVCIVLMSLTTVFQQRSLFGFDEKAMPNEFLPRQRYRWTNFTIILLAACFVILPLLGLCVSAISPVFFNVLAHPATLSAIVNTLMVALATAVLSLTLGVFLLITSRHLRVRLDLHRSGQWLQLVGNIILVIPPIVLGTGLFLLLRPFADIFSIALLLVIAINSLMALPFVLRILDGPMMRAALKYDRVIASLGMQGWRRWHIVDWPVLRRPVGLALAVASTMAAGDLGAIALFGSERVMTLPLLLYQRMGSYRLYDAAVTAVLLLVLCLSLFMLLQRIVGGRVRA